MLKKNSHEIKLVISDELFKDLQRTADILEKPMNAMIADWSDTILNTIEYGSNAFYCDHCKDTYFYKGFFLEAECPYCKE